MEKALLRALSSDRTPKFLATLDAGGMPNIVPVTSIRAADRETLIFAEFMIWKTKKNLLENHHVGVAVLSAELTWWVIKGIFKGFETSGEHFETLSQQDMFRYNAYSGIRSAGVIQVEDVSEKHRLLNPASVAELAAAMLRSRTAPGGRGIMPPPVIEKFRRFKSAKALAVRGDDGFPAAVIASAMLPVGNSHLIVGASNFPDEINLKHPINAAACVITYDPVAYQVKGLLRRAPRIGSLKLASLRVEEVYSASPPLPGKRIA
ncbi:MAG: pyridoxamine 5'-phosphate oxidase family protein [bacterium]